MRIAPVMFGHVDVRYKDRSEITTKHVEERLAPATDAGFNGVRKLFQVNPTTVRVWTRPYQLPKKHRAMGSPTVVTREESARAIQKLFSMGKGRSKPYDVVVVSGKKK